MNNTVFLEIPAVAKYISLARLTIAGIAAGEDLNIDDIEDLKLLITESCNLSYKIASKETIDVAITNEAHTIKFTVSGIQKEKVKESDELNLSAMIIESLADTFEYGDDYLFISKEFDNSNEDNSNYQG